MKTRIFKAKNGSQISSKKVQAYGESLYDLKEKMEGVLTPQSVVETAKSKKSPLHDYFIWDDSIAAEKYRTHQARNLLNSITIEIKIEGKIEDIKPFHNVKIIVHQGTELEEVQRGYVSIESIKENEYYMNQIIEEAHREMSEWGKRYRKYKSLKGFKKFKVIFKQIEQLV